MVIDDMHANGIKPAAILYDRIFSSNGVLSDPAGFAKDAIALAKQEGLLYIADEVQSGFGRTGSHLRGFQRHGVEPDIVPMGKPMGNAQPIAAAVMRSDVVEEFGRTARYLNTFGGNPVPVLRLIAGNAMAESVTVISYGGASKDAQITAFYKPFEKEGRHGHWRRYTWMFRYQLAWVKNSSMEMAMFDISAVVTVLTVSAVGVMIPGPSFVAVVHKAVSGCRTDAIAFVMGIVVVNLIWATCAISGIGMVFKLFPWLAAAVKVAGAAYLVWFGLRLIIASRTAGAKPQMKPKSTGLRAAFFQGAAMNAMNPKSIAFFAAVFSSAAPAHVSTATFFAMLAAVGATALCWYGLVALVLSHATIAKAYQNAKRTVDRICGVLLIGLGVRQIIR